MEPRWVHELPIGSDLKVRPNGVRIKRRLGPREAIALGAADRVSPLDRVPKAILASCAPRASPAPRAPERG